VADLILLLVYSVFCKFWLFLQPPCF
jgi:hypothetical protein